MNRPVSESQSFIWSCLCLSLLPLRDASAAVHMGHRGGRRWLENIFSAAGSTTFSISEDVQTSL